MQCSTKNCPNEASRQLSWRPAATEISDQMPLELCEDCCGQLVALSRLDDVAVEIEMIEKG